MSSMYEEKFLVELKIVEWSTVFDVLRGLYKVTHDDLQFLCGDKPNDVSQVYQELSSQIEQNMDIGYCPDKEICAKLDKYKVRDLVYYIHKSDSIIGYHEDMPNIYCDVNLIANKLSKQFLDQMGSNTH